MPPLKILGLGSFGFRRSGTRVRSCGVAILDKRDRAHLQTEREGLIGEISPPAALPLPSY